MNKKKKIIILVVTVLVLIIAAGVYLYPKKIHMPTRLTYPYDVTITKGNARINGYLSDELEIEIPKRIWGAKVNYIAKDAFKSLGTDVVIKSIPEGVIVAENIYHQESQSYYRLYRDEAELTKYAGNEKKVEIPEEVWRHEVTGISGGLDYGCFENLEIEEVIIPETVISIRGSAFKDCKNLKQIDLPSKLEEIGIMSFEGSGITSIVLPKSIKEIGTSAFKNSDLEEIRGFENVEYIGNDPFRGTPWEESMEGDFIDINNILFLYRGNDEEVIVPSSIREIKGAFSREEEYLYPLNVKKIYVSGSVEVISAYSFSGKDGIEVYIPETVVLIGKAFSSYTDIIFSSHDEDAGTIVTTAGSPAEAYAKEEGVSYRIISREEMQQEMEAAKKRQENKS